MEKIRLRQVLQYCRLTFCSAGLKHLEGMLSGTYVQPTYWLYEVNKMVNAHDGKIQALQRKKNKTKPNHNWKCSNKTNPLFVAASWYEKVRFIFSCLVLCWHQFKRKVVFLPQLPLQSKTKTNKWERNKKPLKTSHHLPLQGGYLVKQASLVTLVAQEVQRSAHSCLHCSVMPWEARPMVSAGRRHAQAEELRFRSPPGDFLRQLGLWQKDLSMSLSVTQYRKHTCRSL